MNQGKLDEVKQEMARMNIDIWGISKKVNLIQKTIISTTVGKKPLESKKWSSPHKRVQNAVLQCNLKNNSMISVYFQGKPVNITVVQVYAPTTNAEAAEVQWFSVKTPNTF